MSDDPEPRRWPKEFPRGVWQFSVTWHGRDGVEHTVRDWTLNGTETLTAVRDAVEKLEQGEHR